MMTDKYAPLSAEEKNMVEKHIGIVEIVVKRYIIINNDINGLGYDDLFQVGCIGLCMAAKTYNGSVLFETYASKVIRNHLIDQCRSALRVNKRVVSSESQSNFDNINSYEINLDNIIMDIDISNLFYEIKKKYSGCVLRGIEALEFKANGYSGTEIAAIYGVKPNLVGAWISKAIKQLRRDNTFRTQLEHKDAI